MSINKIEGHLVGKDLKIGIVVSRFNEFITSKLLSGAIDALIRHGVSESDIDVAWVPGLLKSRLYPKNWLSPKNTMRSLP